MVHSLTKVVILTQDTAGYVPPSCSQTIKMAMEAELVAATRQVGLLKEGYSKARDTLRAEQLVRKPVRHKACSSIYIMKRVESYTLFVFCRPTTDSHIDTAEPSARRDGVPAASHSRGSQPRSADSTCENARRMLPGIPPIIPRICEGRVDVADYLTLALIQEVRAKPLPHLFSSRAFFLFSSL